MSGAGRPPLRRLLRAAARRLLWTLRDRLESPRADPVFVLGHQKSGTTAIAALLAQRLGRRYSNDMISRRRWRDAAEILAGRVPVTTLMARAPSEFAAGVIKDPDFTFIAAALAEAFPAAHFVGVVRDPRTTLRSIYERLDLPGDRARLDLDAAPVLAARPNWRLLFEPEPLGLGDGHELARLAARWVLAVERMEALGPRCTLVRYEDFLADKVGVLDGLATATGLDARGDVSAVLDRPFQRPGRHRGTPAEFFGAANLARIEDVCGPVMARYGYVPTAVGEA